MSHAVDRRWTLAPDPTEVPRIRREVRQFVVEHDGLEPARHPNLDLAVTEVVTNALLHGYRDGGGDPITVDVHVDGKVQITVTDTGVGMRPHPGSPGAGLGLAIVMSIADHVEVSPGEAGGTRVRVTFER